jgi:steroid delta-isomerase-like uncharacterized protein
MDPKTIARRWFEEVWTARRDDLIDELMDTNSAGHVEGGEVRGADAFRQMRDVFINALPDVRIEVEDILSEGDRAAVRWRAVGTHAGEGFGFAASHRGVDVRGTTWLIVRDGKIVEGWDTWNLGQLMETLRAASKAASA